MQYQPHHAQAIYDAMTEDLAAATHRARLRYVRAFFAWCVGRAIGRATRSPK